MDSAASLPIRPWATSPICWVSWAAKRCCREFPELHGVEQELINRCATDELAQRFYDLMQAYSASAPRPCIRASR